MCHEFSYKWTLRDAKFRKDKGKVFTCFAGVGGSTMGYKLAGFDVVGMNEVDERMAECYIVNHRPRHRYVEPIQDFKGRDDLPDELYDLDILDGSPPCTPFSIIGRIVKDWTKERKFKEGGIKQRIDLLFFDFIDLAKKLQPKIVVAENVPAMLTKNRNNIRYVQRIYKEFDSAGYCLQHFVLDASRMGVPQKRKRLFFVAMRNDLAEPFFANAGLLRKKPKLILSWNESIIKFGRVRSAVGCKKRMTQRLKTLLKCRIKSDDNFGNMSKRLCGKNSGFSRRIVHDNLPCPVITTGASDFIRDCDSLLMTDYDIISVSTFPFDFNFCETKIAYSCGMSVPPVMMAHVATEIHRQWLSKMGR